MGIRVIGQKKFEVTETELLQQDLLFYIDNPRVYSVLHENGHDNPTQTEIEEIMCSLDHVKSLKSQIMQNGGLIEPLIVVKRKDRYIVLEGNSRLAAYRILAKNDPLKWSRVLVQILPEDISDSDIFTLLGTFHLNPKKDWSKFEQAAYIYRQKKELGCSDSVLGKQVGISAITVKKYCEIYGLMVEHNDTHQSHWNMYEQYVQNKGIKQYRNTYPEMDSFFAKQVKTGEIVRAQDVRDILGKIASDEGKSSTHIMQDYIKGDIDLEEAHVIYNELRKRGYRVDVGNIMIVEPGKNGKPVKKQLEVDFICSKGSKKYYIQSAYSLETEEKMAQEIRPFTKINDSFKKIVITSNTPKPFYNDDGILMMSVFDFLLKQESLEL